MRARVCALQITSPDQPEVFPDGAGGQAGHRQATLPVPDHGGGIIHHHRHVPPPQGRDGAAAGSRPELSVIKGGVLAQSPSRLSSAAADGTCPDLLFVSASHTPT